MLAVGAAWRCWFFAYFFLSRMSYFTFPFPSLFETTQSRVKPKTTVQTLQTGQSQSRFLPGLTSYRGGLYLVVIGRR